MVPVSVSCFFFSFFSFYLALSLDVGQLPIFTLRGDLEKMQPEMFLNVLYVFSNFITVDTHLYSFFLREGELVQSTTTILHYSYMRAAARRLKQPKDLLTDQIPRLKITVNLEMGNAQVFFTINRKCICLVKYVSVSASENMNILFLFI